MLPRTKLKMLLQKLLENEEVGARCPLSTGSPTRIFVERDRPDGLFDGSLID